jgi:2,3-bisphosphoglycerate-dependent phosphoglycerate mutase
LKKFTAGVFGEPLLPSGTKDEVHLKPTILWLARHAETATPNVFHGAESDVELGAHGQRQAIAAAEWYASELKPTVVVSSGMRRAIDTATPIAVRCGVRHVIVPALHERRVGALGGTSFAGGDGPWPETVRRWTAGEIDYTTPGAESFAELQTRLVPAINGLVKHHPGERIAVIAHGIVCKVLLLSLLPDWGPTGWERLGHVMNLSTSELQFDDGKWLANWLTVIPPDVTTLNQSRGERLP